MNMKARKMWWFTSLMALLLVAPGLAFSPAQAQEGSRLFPETGKTVKGPFLQYWNTHGGLPQQGFPISEEMQEVSETDGKSYTVQYFERAVFEWHPEETPEFQVLLSLLGVFYYNQKFPQGAPNQAPNNEPGSVLVPETGKRLGGIFKTYWETHGGLAQQGYPISDEFNEVSDLNGKTYRVQYFQRAVFEYHPEEGPEFQVLLSQLGTFRYKAKYLTPATATAEPTAVPPTNTPAATETPTVERPLPTALPLSPTPTPRPGLDCTGIPENRNMHVATNCGRAVNSTFPIFAYGFNPDEQVRVCVVAPGQTRCGSGTPVFERAAGDGTILSTFIANQSDPTGIWTITMDGQQSGQRAIGHFKLLP
jgi:hypothetical protein